MEAPTMSAAQFEQLGRETAKYKQSRSAKVRLRRFKSHFGVAPEVVADTWELLIESRFLIDKLPGLQAPDPVHMLWALMHLKRYETMDVLATALKIDEATLEKWAHFYLEAIAELDSGVVSFVDIVYLTALAPTMAVICGLVICGLVISVSPTMAVIAVCVSCCCICCCTTTHLWLLLLQICRSCGQIDCRVTHTIAAL